MNPNINGRFTIKRKSIHITFVGHHKQHRIAFLSTLLGHRRAAVQKGFLLSFIFFLSFSFASSSFSFIRSSFSPSLLIVPFHHLLHFNQSIILYTYLSNIMDIIGGGGGADNAPPSLFYKSLLTPSLRVRIA